MKQRFAIVIEKAGDNYSAYVPDVPGCIAVGDSPEETKRNLAEALEFHLEGMVEFGEALPIATSLAGSVEVAVPVPSEAKA